ncbi:MAG: DNA repair protein RecO [Pseudomonadota bacterium]
MEWRDQGVVLSLRPHGEHAAIVEVFTAEHGRHAGVVRGGVSRKIAPFLQPGTQLEVTWRARLEDHIGGFAVEPLRSRAGVLGDRRALAGLNAICALLRFCLPERAAHRTLYEASQMLLDALEMDEDWPFHYLSWEVTLLEEMGFGLDLSQCAVTGQAEGLIYVSPNSGRAVSRDGAGRWADRLLPFPPCLVGRHPAGLSDILSALRTTGHFLAHRMAPELGTRPLPRARRRLIDALSRDGAGTSALDPDAI